MSQLVAKQEDILNSIIEKSGFWNKPRKLGHADLLGTTISKETFEVFLKNLNSYKIDPFSFYKLNSYGLRSDEFSKTHNGRHILFAGCSVTFGDSLQLEHIWPYKVYQKFLDKDKMSGYYNIAFPGATRLQIFSQIYKYIDKFGNPEIIFINLPDLKREFGYSDNIGKINNIVFGIYFGLINYCKSNNIKLFCFSWDEHENISDNILNKKEKRKVECFYRYHIKKEKFLHMNNYYENNKNDKYSKHFIKAFDEMHPGIAEHDFYANFIYNKYIDSLGAQDEKN